MGTRDDQGNKIWDSATNINGQLFPTTAILVPLNDVFYNKYMDQADDPWRSTVMSLSINISRQQFVFLDCYEYYERY